MSTVLRGPPAFAENLFKEWLRGSRKGGGIEKFAGSLGIWAVPLIRIVRGPVDEFVALLEPGGLLARKCIDGFRSAQPILCATPVARMKRRGMHGYRTGALGPGLRFAPSGLPLLGEWWPCSLFRRMERKGMPRCCPSDQMRWPPWEQSELSLSFETL